MDAFGIFEGGGAKGLAHIGALKVAQEERYIKFIGVAGTSAGSIVAALIAVGYTPSELYTPDLKTNPDGKKGLFDLDYPKDFFIDDWDILQNLQNDFQKKFNGVDLISAYINTVPFYFRNRAVLEKAQQKKGFLSTGAFKSWLNELLSKALKLKDIPITGNNGMVLFRDVPITLKIITTDITNCNSLVYSKQNTPNVPVADAVSCSISIPGIFPPQKVHPETFQLISQTDSEQDGLRIVDGFLTSNFPLWVFDEERRLSGLTTPVFGFKLVERQGNNPRPSSDTLLDYLGMLSGTLLAGGIELETRAIDNLYVIPLKVSVSALKFDLEPNEKDRLYEDGENAVRKFFALEFGPGDPKRIKKILNVACNRLKQDLNIPNLHLRVYVVLPQGKERTRLRVMFHNFDETDSDDRLEFAPNVWGVGECWVQKISIIRNRRSPEPEDAPWIRLNKYQRALIPPSQMHTLRCDPIQKQGTQEIIGVFCIDSNLDVEEAFARVGEIAAETAFFLADEFSR